MFDADKLLNGRNSQYTFWLVIMLLLALILDNMVFGPRIGGLTGNYILPTIMWGFIILVLSKFPGTRAAGKLRLHKLLCYLALMCFLLSVLAQIMHGLLATFGQSPYDRSLFGILINLVSIGALVTGMEMGRAWLMNRHFLRKPVIGIPLIGLLFTSFSISLNKITGLHDGLAVIKFMGMNYIPELGQSLVSTYLVFLGGPLPAIIYRASLMAFERISPVLPNANWPIQTLFGVLVPVLGFMLVRVIYREETREERPIAQEDTPLEMVLTSLAIVVIIWFSLGVFSYSPRVILSGSMQPNIDIGDIVIIKEINAEQARVGDVIMFPLNNMLVTHRVIDIQQKDGKKYFTTKGDGNTEPERDPVIEENVKGKVIMVIPKAGRITMLMRGGV